MADTEMISNQRVKSANIRKTKNTNPTLSAILAALLISAFFESGAPPVKLNSSA
jgi:hypothetical protein